MLAHINSNRFSRQLILPEISKTGQEKLKRAKVLCVGVGGLGSPVTLYLAAAGVGHLGLIDPDHVAPSNLQRQVLFKTCDLDHIKVAAAKDHLLGLSPETEISAIADSLTAKNAETLFAQYDLIVDGTDNFETKFLINDAAYKTDKPVVFGSVDRFEGQVALFYPHLKNIEQPCYRCFFPNLPQSKIQNCAEAGVLGSVVGVIGTLQATLALQYLIADRNSSHPLFPDQGKLTHIDLRGGWNFRTLQIKKNKACPTCSKERSSITLQDQTGACTSIVANASNISRIELTQLLQNESYKVVLIDVRETEEWQKGFIPGAQHWPLERLKKNQFPEVLNQNQTPHSIPTTVWVTYCQSGARSRLAAYLIEEKTKFKVLSLTGGISEWNSGE